jgi:hypothetical protein
VAVPTSYTDASFKTYLDAVLSDVADLLGWSTGAGDYDEALNDALFLADVDAISDVAATRAAIAKLRTCGRIAVWRAACAALSSRYDLKTGPDSLNRGQLYEHAQAQLRSAERDGMLYGINYTVETTSVTHEDYYGPSDLEDQYYRYDTD